MLARGHGGELELGRFSSSTSRRRCRSSVLGAVAVDGGSGFDHSDIRLCRGHVTSGCSTKIRLHTRLGRAHECRSGVWLCAFSLMSQISYYPRTLWISFRVYLLALFPTVVLVGEPMILRAVPTEDYLFYSSFHAQLLPCVLQSLLFRLLRLQRLIEARTSRARALPDESPC
uniref:Uncharacterized protein n=1 Tax=Ananas comosus var. bracteatus TaxID=296719 RepID=A0A6V7QAZ0_ANACO|nr:unnamed protein product [Ananas comosus var. bracteatus]